MAGIGSGEVGAADTLTIKVYYEGDSKLVFERVGAAVGCSPPVPVAEFLSDKMPLDVLGKAVWNNMSDLACAALKRGSQAVKLAEITECGTVWSAASNPATDTGGAISPDFVMKVYERDHDSIVFERMPGDIQTAVQAIQALSADPDKDGNSTPLDPADYFKSDGSLTALGRDCADVVGPLIAGAFEYMLNVADSLDEAPDTRCCDYNNTTTVYFTYRCCAPYVYCGWCRGSSCGLYGCNVW